MIGRDDADALFGRIGFRLRPLRLIALSLSAMLERDLAIGSVSVCLSVCTSVRPSRSSILWKRLN